MSRVGNCRGKSRLEARTLALAAGTAGSLGGAFPCFIPGAPGDPGLGLTSGPQNGTRCAFTGSSAFLDGGSGLDGGGFLGVGFFGGAFFGGALNGNGGGGFIGRSYSPDGNLGGGLNGRKRLHFDTGAYGVVGLGGDLALGLNLGASVGAGPSS